MYIIRWYYMICTGSWAVIFSNNFSIQLGLWKYDIPTHIICFTPNHWIVIVHVILLLDANVSSPLNDLGRFFLLTRGTKWYMNIVCCCYWILHQTVLTLKINGWICCQRSGRQLQVVHVLAVDSSIVRYVSILCVHCMKFWV